MYLFEQALWEGVSHWTCYELIAQALVAAHPFYREMGWEQQMSVGTHQHKQRSCCLLKHLPLGCCQLASGTTSKCQAPKHLLHLLAMHVCRVVTHCFAVIVPPHDTNQKGHERHHRPAWQSVWCERNVWIIGLLSSYLEELPQSLSWQLQREGRQAISRLLGSLWLQHVVLACCFRISRLTQWHQHFESLTSPVSVHRWQFSRVRKKCGAAVSHRQHNLQLTFPFGWWDTLCPLNPSTPDSKGTALCQVAGGIKEGWMWRELLVCCKQGKWQILARPLKTINHDYLECASETVNI